MALSPLGLLATGSAWGEWSAAEVGKQVGFVPRGMRALESLWHTPLSAYNIAGSASKLLQAGGYIISAVIGVAIILFIFKLFALALPENGPHDSNNKT